MDTLIETLIMPASGDYDVVSGLNSKVALKFSPLRVVLFYCLYLIIIFNEKAKKIKHND